MTDNAPANAGVKLFRSFCALIDTGVYTLLGFMYEIFFNVASADLFANETILGFYKRVQLIIGVYMVFQLAILIMKGIFNTDAVSGKNNNEFVKKIIIALVMLTVITPISIPNAQNEYEKQINNNGLLFGTLYSLQYRILNNNTIGRLVLGTNDTMSSTSNNSNNTNSSSVDSLTQSANIFSTTILKGFFRINLVDKDKRVEPDPGKAIETKNKNRMCQDIDNYTMQLYVENKSTPGDLLTLVNATCTPDSNALTGGVYEALTFFGLSSKSKFVFAYMPFISTIVGIVFIVIMISFTIDIAVRAIKLAVLRLIAPIPIISYMDPNGSKDSGFNSWVKTLTQTYLDLFIRLASVYFVIYLIQDMIANGIYMNKTMDAVGVISFIFICIGLFLFAKEAPKFLQSAIGMKSEPMNIFGTALGRGAALAGGVGSFAAGMKASRLSDETRQAAGENVNPDSIFNKGKHLLAGFAGGIGGVGAGLSAVGGAKDHHSQAAIEAMQKRNRDALAKGNAGSSLMGRVGSTAHGMVFGESKSSTLTRDMQSLEADSKAHSAFIDFAEKKVATSAGWTTGTATYKDESGNDVTVESNYSDFQKRLQDAESQGLDRFKLANNQEITTLQARQIDSALKDSNVSDFITKKGRKDPGKENVEVETMIKDFEAIHGQGSFEQFVSDSNKGGSSDVRDAFSDKSKKLAAEAATKKRQNAIQEANDRFSGGKK